jgi:hypothetical protein
MKFKLLIALNMLLAVAFTNSCTKKVDFNNIAMDQWRADLGGCQGKRAQLIAAIKARKNELKGVTANDIGELFGTPEVHRLDQRNQEYYVYFLEKGPHCGKIRPISDSKSLMFRFNALGLTTEITFQNGSL